MSPELADLIRRAKEYVDAMAPEQKTAMLREQVEEWARSEAQWAKDFRDGKRARD